MVILPDEEVSTSIGTLYSSSFGMTASVSVELQAPIITGTLSLTISFSAVATASVGLDLLSSTIELDLLAEHAAGLVDLLLGDLGALRHVVAGGGEGAGQRLGDADLDGVLRRGGAGQRSVAPSAASANLRAREFHTHLPLLRRRYCLEAPPSRPDGGLFQGQQHHRSSSLGMRPRPDTARQAAAPCRSQAHLIFFLSRGMISLATASTCSFS